ncbi:Tetratricopeptide repeat-containing protein [Pararobbsia alpina]|uniref:hypothetical protein n=1 Tax=Pararobbsia alpina TaxID=621374 RepID=UPI0039A4AFCB
MAIADVLDGLMKTHDDAPEAAASRLRVLATQAVPADQLGRFGWLVNHVIGEKQGRWKDANLLISEAMRPHDALPLPALRSGAVAALVSGDLLRASAIESRLATQHRLRAMEATMVVRMAALSFLVTGPRAQEAALGILGVVQIVAGWNAASQADASLASSLNNAVSSLIELDDKAIASPEVRDAIVEGARAARILWMRAGGWTHHERADYLCALAANRLGLHDEALEAAERGLKIIDENGVEDVDRAFLLLETVRAYRGLGRDNDATRHFSLADKLASAWDDKDTIDWYASKSAALRAPQPQ